MVPGIILAAGQSSRMGRPKALLPCKATGDTFVATLLRSVLDGGVDDALVIGRPDDVALREEVERNRGRFVENPRHEQGQLSSLLAGLNVADRPGVTGVLVTPVDAPLVAPSSVAALLRAFTTSQAPIVRAAYGGRNGHPVIFARAVFDALRHADPSIGAKAVLRAHHDRLLNVEVPDRAVVDDVDTPEDYRRIFGPDSG
jgi:molybdenum cofactor cytidylyltransferase